jgi:hypothetical protein
MLKSATFRTIAGVLRTTADTVEKLATTNDTNPQAAMVGLLRIMVSLADTATYTAQGLSTALTVVDMVGGIPKEAPRQESSSPDLPALRCECPGCTAARAKGATHTPRDARKGAN